MLTFCCKDTEPRKAGMTFEDHSSDVKVKVKEGHTPKERRRGAHLPFIGR